MSDADKAMKCTPMSEALVDSNWSVRSPSKLMKVEYVSDADSILYERGPQYVRPDLSPLSRLTKS